MVNGKKLREFQFHLPFLICAGFSAVAVIKSKHRAKIKVEKEIRVTVASLILRLDKIYGSFIPLIIII